MELKELTNKEIIKDINKLNKKRIKVTFIDKLNSKIKVQLLKDKNFKRLK